MIGLRRLSARRKDLLTLIADKPFFVASLDITRLTSISHAYAFRARNSIFSKKYMENPPELKAGKQKHNVRTLKKMAEMMVRDTASVNTVTHGRLELVRAWC